MAKHRQKIRRGKVTMASAAVSTVATVMAPSAFAATAIPNPTLGQPVIFVDGTNPEEGDGAQDLALEYFLPPEPGSAFYVVDYPKSFGILTGLGDPGYDESRDIGATATAAAVAEAREDNSDGTTIYVVGYSQGADATVEAKEQLLEEGVVLSNVVFVEAASPRNNDGGILARLSFLPVGVYVPLVGVTIGGPAAGNPPSAGVQEFQIVIQYEGVADAPKYPLNVVASANAIAGFILLHGDYDDVNLNDTDNLVVTTTPTTEDGGSITNILVLTDELPLLTVAKMVGMPDDVAVALDPFLGAVVEAGYDRPDPEVTGSYPTEPVPFALVKPLDELAEDAQNISVGFEKTVDQLADLKTPETPLRDQSELRVTTRAPAGPKPKLNLVRNGFSELGASEGDTRLTDKKTAGSVRDKFKALGERGESGGTEASGFRSRRGAPDPDEGADSAPVE